MNEFLGERLLTRIETLYQSNISREFFMHLPVCLFIAADGRRRVDWFEDEEGFEFLGVLY